MKLQVEKPSGHSMRVEGRVKDVSELFRAWWAATPEEEPEPKRVVGFQAEVE